MRLSTVTIKPSKVRGLWLLFPCNENEKHIRVLPKNTNKKKKDTTYVLLLLSLYLQISFALRLWMRENLYFTPLAWGKWYWELIGFSLPQVASLTCPQSIFSYSIVNQHQLTSYAIRGQWARQRAPGVGLLLLKPCCLFCSSDCCSSSTKKLMRSFLLTDTLSVASEEAGDSKRLWWASKLLGTQYLFI